MVDRGDGKKSDTYGPPASRHYVNQGLKQQQQQQLRPCFHEVVPTAIKVVNDPQLFPYPLKEGWWAMMMVHLVHDNVN